MDINYFGSSDIGRIRSANQDNFYTSRLCENSLLCVVCDGMGGARGGNVASALAAEVFSERLKRLAAAKISQDNLRLTPESACRMLDDSVQAANLAVYKKSLSSPEFSGMGTTLVAVLFCGDVVYAVNVGDSRLYLVSDGDITQITHDHSYVQHLIDSGSLTAEEARSHPFRNRITRAVGIGADIEADIFSIELSGLDSCYLLLCSDGLHGLLLPEELRDTILSDGLETENEDSAPDGDEPQIMAEDGENELSRKVKLLIDAANSAGGSDNITAVLIKYTGSEEAPTTGGAE